MKSQKEAAVSGKQSRTRYLARQAKLLCRDLTDDQRTALVDQCSNQLHLLSILESSGELIYPQDYEIVASMLFELFRTKIEELKNRGYDGRADVVFDKLQRNRRHWLTRGSQEHE